MSERASGTCEWCGGRQFTHVGAGNYWECPICHPSRIRPGRGLNITERERIERHRRPMPPGYQEALDRDDAVRASYA